VPIIDLEVVAPQGWRQGSMCTNAFIGKSEAPSEAELAAALGASKMMWDGLVKTLTEEYDVPTQEWYSYSPKAGWALRAKRRQRTIVYLSPSKGCFTASFILGGKAVEVVRASTLPRKVIQIIDEAKRHPEGTGVRIEVKTAGDIAAVKKLVVIKLEN
jgi:hypothetical protein